VIEDPDSDTSFVPVRDFRAGEYLFREGEAGKAMFVIQRGMVELVTSVGGERVTLAELGDGAFVGETALVTGGAHQSAAIAREPTHCLVVDAVTLETLVTSDAEIAVRFIRGLGERVEAALGVLRARGAPVAEAPAAAPPTDPVRRLVLHLVELGRRDGERSNDGVWLHRRLADVCAEIGVDEQTAAAASRELLRAGLMRVRRGGLLLTDLARLDQFVRQRTG
jgi:CRP-like cAMP-binding protein